MTLKISAKLKRKSPEKLAKAIAGLKRLADGPDAVKIGWPAGTDGGIVDRAFFNEFGTEGSGKGFKTPRGGGFGGPIPERPALRLAMRANRAKYQRAAAAGAREILHGVIAGQDPVGLKTSFLSRLGIMGQGDVQSEITSLSSPPNSPVTIKLKGSSNPLIDTGQMRAAVTYQVVSGDNGLLSSTSRFVQPPRPLLLPSVAAGHNHSHNAEDGPAHDDRSHLTARQAHGAAGDAHGDNRDGEDQQLAVGLSKDMHEHHGDQPDHDHQGALPRRDARQASPQQAADDGRHHDPEHSRFVHLCIPPGRSVERAA
jgi:hypothetical protein